MIVLINCGFRIITTRVPLIKPTALDHAPLSKYELRLVVDYITAENSTLLSSAVSRG